MDKPTSCAVIVIIAVALVAASCARGPSEGTLAESDRQWLPPLPEDIQPPPAEWGSLSHEQQAQHMHDRVIPTMGPLFREFDGERFASVGCATCHGARENEFSMPNPSLPALPRPGSPAWEAMASEQYQMFRFMSERVEPTMATLVGAQPYDHLTREGYGCFQCHTRAD